MFVIGKQYEEMDDKETIIKVTTILERLVTEVSELSKKVDTLKDGHIKDQGEDLAVHGEKIKKLESTLYGVLWLVAGETVALVSAVITYFVFK